jgi:SAM-dependent methyltransferase
MYRDTAHVYDLIYSARGKDYATEAANLDHLIQERRPEAATLLDVACGTGAHLVHLRDRYAVTGLDLEPAMLAVAQRRLPDVELIEGDMRTFQLGRSFDAIVCLFSAIGYMRNQEELDSAIGTMARHLVPGGVLVVDGWVRADAWRDETIALDTAESDDVKVARISRSERDGARIHNEMHHLIATVAGVDHVVDHHELNLFEPQEYETAFTNAGLHVFVVESPMPDRDRYVGVRVET